MIRMRLLAIAMAFPILISPDDCGPKPDVNYDYDGNGKSDFFLRDGDSVRILPNNGLSPLDLVMDPSLRKVGSGQADSDRADELFFQLGDTGEIRIYDKTASDLVQIDVAGSATEHDVEVLGVGDFDDDERAEVLQRRRLTGAVEIVYFDNRPITAVDDGAGPVSMPLHQKVVAVADYDGDDNSDVLWWSHDLHATRGHLTLWTMQAQQVSSDPVLTPFSPTEWQIHADGDFNHDGRGDILLRHPELEPALLFYMDGANPPAFEAVAGLGTPPDQLATFGTGDHDGEDTTSEVIADWDPEEAEDLARVGIFDGVATRTGDIDFGSGFSVAHLMNGKDRSTAFRNDKSTVTQYRPPSFWGGGGNWSVDDVIDLLACYPQHYVFMGYTGLPTGSVPQTEMGTIINALQSRGVPSSRLILGWRNDVQSSRPPAGQAWCAPHCGWNGILEPSDPFLSQWIITVPRVGHHDWAVARWNDVDPWSSLAATHPLAAANTETHVGALYGTVDGEVFEPGSVLTDVRNGEYRAWSYRKLMADLEVMGIEPGDEVVLEVTFKPGWHSWYDEESEDASQRGCNAADSNMWRGPALPNSTCDGPFERTPYAPGEFEIAMNLTLQELRAALVENGYDAVKILTTEAPAYRDQKWILLDSENREASSIIGERFNFCDRTDLGAPPGSGCPAPAPGCELP